MLVPVSLPVTVTVPVPVPVPVSVSSLLLFGGSYSDYVSIGHRAKMAVFFPPKTFLCDARLFFNSALTTS
jgi:hypothetical protein